MSKDKSKPKSAYNALRNEVCVGWGYRGCIKDGEHYAAAWQAFLKASTPWLRVVERQGEAAVRETWAALLDGKTRPEEGYILSL